MDKEKELRNIEVEDIAWISRVPASLGEATRLMQNQPIDQYSHQAHRSAKADFTVPLS